VFVVTGESVYDRKEYAKAPAVVEDAHLSDNKTINAASQQAASVLSATVAIFICIIISSKNDNSNSFYKL